MINKTNINKAEYIERLKEIKTKTYLDENNKLNPVVMGSYGIGIERIAAAVVEQNNDEKGIIWPISVAPFKCSIVIANTKDETQVNLANKLYDELQ